MSGLEAAAHGPELLDDCRAAPALVRETLRNIARANRWLGGAAAVRYGLRRALNACRARTVSMLDVGTGRGDLPQMAVAWAARRGVDLFPIGLEHHRVAARVARERGLLTVMGDGGSLPFRDASVDLVLLSQVAHHFAPLAVVRLLRECARVARHAVIIADLRRSAFAAFTFPVAGRLLRFDRHTIADGVTSLRRGFTPSTLGSLLTQAGFPARVARRPGARLVAVCHPRS